MCESRLMRIFGNENERTIFMNSIKRKINARLVSMVIKFLSQPISRHGKLQRTTALRPALQSAWNRTRRAVAI